LIAKTVEAAHRAGKWVGMCGEAAGNPEWAALWLGLGLDELSMSPASIPAVKEAIRGTRFDEAQQLAALALQQPTLQHVEALLRRGM
jgi:phosphotransferase system enzyme I (PtsI)